MGVTFKKPGEESAKLFSLSAKSKFQKVEERVLLLLEQVPTIRNDDRELFEVYLSEFHNITTLRQYRENLNCPTIETLRRVRQKIQEKGLYLPTDPKVRAARNMLEKEYHEYGKEVK